MSYTITKKTIESYKFRHSSRMYWADINIDANGNQGRIQIASDFGDWQNFWGACGHSFKSFLLSLDIDYAADKFGADRYFDLDKTLDAYRNTVIAYRKAGTIDATTARNIFNQCKELEDDIHEADFVAELWHKEHLMKFFDYQPDLERDITPGFKRFWNEIWPQFKDVLKKEIQEEALAQECNATKAK